MPFNLKNPDTAYQKMMNKVFKNHIKDLLKVYMEDIDLQVWT